MHFLRHYSGLEGRIWVSGPTGPRSFPILQSPCIWAYFLHTYLFISCYIPHQLVICLHLHSSLHFVVHSPSPCKSDAILFPPSPELFLLTQHLSTFVAYSSHHIVTLWSIAFNLCQKVPAKFHQISFTPHSYHSSLCDLPPFLSLGTLSLHMQTFLAATSSMLFLLQIQPSWSTMLSSSLFCITSFHSLLQLPLKEPY